MAARRRNPSAITGSKELKRLSKAVNRIARHADRLTEALARLEGSRSRPPARRRARVKAAAAGKK